MAKNSTDKKNSKTFEVLRSFVAGHVNLPSGITPSYVVLLIFLIFIYITNHLDAEKELRTISDLTAEIKELGYEQITTQSELMNMSKQSEVLRRTKAENLELQELTEPPRIIKR